MKQVELSARVRSDSGKKVAHTLRSGGEIPGILYGHKEEPVSLAIPAHEFWTILHHATTEHLILSVTVDGLEKGTMLTLVKAVQHHPVTGDILHVDLQRISSDEKIKVGVPVNLIGIPKGVKDFGGILDHRAREVRIISTPANIPESIDIDVSHLLLGDSIHVEDIIGQFKELDIFDDDSTLIAAVAAPKKLELEEIEAAEAAEGEEAAEGAEGKDSESEDADEEKSD
ncbi:MAG: 50S ribosomal protein L25 [Candidatus Krumholzibacteriota bacterium]|nr:50S ribosomal protein L25 [Candidatus Krumholzibacteriota bacterium]